MRYKAVMTLRLGIAATIIGLLSFSPPFACAQTHFYQGKTITLVQSSDAGDTSDTMVRAALPTLKRHIPGEPAIKLQFMPGGGGTQAVYYNFNNAKPDDLVANAALTAPEQTFDVDHGT